MFDLNSSLRGFAAKVALAVTFIVTISACSHEQVAMESMADIPNAEVNNTVESVPDAPAAAPSATAQVAHNARRMHRRGHHHKTVAKIAKHRQHIAKHDHRVAMNRTHTVARVSEISQTPPPSLPPAVVTPVPQAPIAAALAAAPITQEGNDWIPWTVCIVAIGLIGLGVRAGLRKTGVPGRRRRLTFNA